MITYVRITDGLIGTTAHAFLAALADLGVVDVRMPVPEKHDFPQHVVGTGFHALPAGLAAAPIQLDVLRLQVAQ
jgi:hypothetical protein